MRSVRIKASISALLLLCAMLFGALSAAAVDADRLSEADSSSLGLDYSLPYAPRAVIAPSQLLMGILASFGDTQTPCEAETDYLDRYFPEELILPDALPLSLVTVTEGENGTLVRAEAYRAVGSDGGVLLWLPVRLSDGTPLTLSADGHCYEATVSDPSRDSLTVVYACSVTLSEEAVNRLLSYAYTEATDAMGSDLALAAYSHALAEYKAYLKALEEYERDVGRYEAYLSEQAAYEAALLRYTENLAEWEAYRKQSAAYEAYLTAYLAYSEKLTVYKSEWHRYETAEAKYSAYVETLSRIRASLHTVESMFLYSNTHQTQCLFDALQNAELVTMFEKYQGLLTSAFGIPEETIRSMRIHSDELNELLRGYSEARLVSERDAFDFYRANYSRICELFNLLYGEMSSVMSPTIYNLICGKLELEYGMELGAYKKWRVKNVLCHIYLVCLCLNDKELAEGTWSFYADTGDPFTYHFSDLLDQKQIITDTNSANPANLVYPEEPERITPPVLPTEPTAVRQPLEPETVSQPTAPTPIAKPTVPTAVEEPILPDRVDYALLERTAEIQGALTLGMLPKRDSHKGTLTLSVASRSLPLPPTASPNTYLLLKPDGSLLRAIPSGEALPKGEDYSDGIFDYAFRGWSEDPYAEKAPHADPSAPTLCYPLYDVAPARVSVTFSVDGRETSLSVPYGTVPVFGGSTEKPCDGPYDYTFTTWSPAPAPARQSECYVASYLASPHSYTVTFALKGQNYALSYGWEEEPLCPVLPPTVIESGILYEFSGWDTALSPVHGDRTYTALYRTTELCALPDGATDTPVITADGEGYLLTVRSDTVRLSGILALASPRLSIRMEQAELLLTLDREALNSLSRHEFVTLRLLSDQNGIGVGFYSPSGELLSLEGASRIRLSPHASPDAVPLLRVYLPGGLFTERQPFTYSDGGLYTSLRSGALYRTVEQFPLTVYSMGNGDVVAGGSLFAVGEPVLLSFFPHAEHHLVGIVLVNLRNGDTVPIDPHGAVIMPDYPAQIVACYSPVYYSVTFLHEGGSEKQFYKLGEKVTPPYIPSSFEADGYYHTFIGWSETVRTVTGDAEYTAKYYRVPLSEHQDISETPSASSSILLRYVLPALALLCALGAIALAVILLIRSRRRKKRSR